MIILKSLDTLEFKFKHSFHKLGLNILIDNSGSIHNSKLFQPQTLKHGVLFQQYSINTVCDIPFITHTSPWF